MYFSLLETYLCVYKSQNLYRVILNYCHTVDTLKANCYMLANYPILETKLKNCLVLVLTFVTTC